MLHPALSWVALGARSLCFGLLFYSLGVVVAVLRAEGFPRIMRVIMCGLSLLLALLALFFLYVHLYGLPFSFLRDTMEQQSQLLRQMAQEDRENARVLKEQMQTLWRDNPDLLGDPQVFQ